MQPSTTNTVSNTLSYQTESNTTFHYSSDFLEWLRTEKISLAVSTYQTNKLFLIGRDTTKHLFVSEKSFERAMGLHVESENCFYLSTRFLLWRFENTLAEGQKHKEADKVFIPRQAFTTGDLDAHDISKDDNGDIVFVNTRYNCIAKISEKYSFKPLWIPPFISKMVSEDRCHLNGMAMRDGKPRYVTMVSQTDRLDAWREHRHNGGVVMDMETSEVLAEGLSMPHSPRYYQDKLWVLNAGRGEFGYVEDNKFVVITQLDGFLRGLAFYKNYALIGLSKPRHERTFRGLPLEEILNERQTEAKCGIFIVDINTGELIHSLEAEGEIVELYDVQVLPNTKRPFTIDLKTDDIIRFIAIEGDDDTVDFKALASLSENKDKFPSPYSREEEKQSSSPQQHIDKPKQENSIPDTIDPNLSATSKEAIKYQIATISVEQAINTINKLTFPTLSLQSTARKINAPLLVILAHNNQHQVGAIVIEALQNNKVGKVLSWYVIPPFRGLGIGKQLLSWGEKALRKNKFDSILLEYRSDWKSINSFEHILESKKWTTPKANLYFHKFSFDSYQELANNDWNKSLKLPTDFEIVLWSDLKTKELEKIKQKKTTLDWYPNQVSPFNHQAQIDTTTSTALKYKSEVVGWMITHRTKKDTVEHTALFVDPKSNQNLSNTSSLALSLIMTSARLGNEQGVKYGIWQIEVGNRTMIKFINRFLKPYLLTFTENKFTLKIF